MDHLPVNKYPTLTSQQEPNKLPQRDSETEERKENTKCPFKKRYG